MHPDKEEKETVHCHLQYLMEIFTCIHAKFMVTDNQFLLYSFSSVIL